MCCDFIKLGRYIFIMKACLCMSLLNRGSTGLFTVNDIHNMTYEIQTMKHFDHPNVMTLIGVCVSIGGGPAIIMPYMENGSLLSYLRNDKKNITTSDDQDLETVRYTSLTIKFNAVFSCWFTQQKYHKIRIEI